MTWAALAEPVCCRVICMGNRYVADDAFGPHVHDLLKEWGMPTGVELIDGGIAGMNLLRCFDHVKRVIVVDAVKGFGLAGTIVELSQKEAISAEKQEVGHGAGLPVLLRMMELTCETETPSVTIIGAELPADEQSVRTAACRVLRLLESDDGMTMISEGK